MSIQDQSYPLPRVDGYFQPFSPRCLQAVVAVAPMMVKHLDVIQLEHVVF